MAVRVEAFIDGFNFYHAVNDLGADHLKWVNLRALCEHFAQPPDYELGDVFYFSAFATWRPASHQRHRAFVSALRASGVQPVMGKFKEKPRHCRSCGATWTGHEEKETDVNLALYLVLEAVTDKYDRALLISGDSDLAPAVRLVKSAFPRKDIRIIAPPGRGHSMDLYRAAGGQKHCRRMQRQHVEKHLFGREIYDDSGLQVAQRPPKYDPPAR